MNGQRTNREGIALLLAVLALIIILGAVTVVVYRVHSTKRVTDFAVTRAELEEASKAGIDFAIEQVWNQYIIGNGNTTGNLASYHVFLDNLVATNEDANRNGQQDAGESDADGSGTFDINPVWAVISREVPPMQLQAGSRIVELTADRYDDISGTTLTIRSTAEKAGQEQTLAQTVRVSGRLFQGFEFAILANNINCILCHAEVRNLDLDFNLGTPSTYGTFDRVKVAALQSLLIRESEASSNVAGATYTRGRVYDKNGNELSASAIASSTIGAYQFSTDNGKIAQDSSGNMTRVSLQNAGHDSQGRLSQFANMYLDYPSAEAEMTDGNLPTDFPAPFPDDNGNRSVDDSEFTPVMNSASGSISGGVVYGVPQGSTFSGNNLPAASNGALADLSGSGTYNGNVIMIGTPGNPIVIDKKVAINGDLIVKGPVKGWGELDVRGNVYMVGDVTYADAPNKFGEAVDGTKNGLALTAGGNIMIGDYLTIRAKNNMKKGTPDYVDPYVWQGQFIRTDVETANATMSSGKTTKVGYFDPGVVDAGAAQGTEGQYSFTTSELTLFNRMEHLKAQADPSYKPRYYRLRDSAPVYEYVAEHVTNGDLLEHSVNYLSPGVEVISDTSNATVLSLNPKSYWVTENQLRRFWWTDEANRRALGGRQPWKIDGLLYSNNSIFSVIRSYGRHKSQCYGTLNVRGAIVCADLGVLMIDNSYLSTTGLRFFYDRRVRDFLRIEDTTQVQFQRVALTYQ